MASNDKSRITKELKQIELASKKAIKKKWSNEKFWHVIKVPLERMRKKLEPNEDDSE
jgi:hypothetical protein